ncbi:hypothetical protein V8E53_013550, partial [Lactarius tabidus]
ELAELLAFDFNVTHGEIPKLNSGWQGKDHEQAVLSTCSGLITVDPGHGSQIVKFSHFSVKEFLMADRLAKSTRVISQYHISLEDAHRVLAQAPLGVQLRDSDITNDTDSTPLAGYAARHWVMHTQSGMLRATRVRDGMEYLFDPDKPYLMRRHDVDADSSAYFASAPDSEPGTRPLYYVALCGFHKLTEHLILKYPQCASAHPP